MRKIKNSLLMIVFMLLIGITFNVQAESFEYYITNTSSTEPANANDIKDVKRGDIIIVNAMLFNRDNVVDYKISNGKLTIRWDEKFVSLQEVNGKYYNISSSDIVGLNIGTENKSSNKITLSEISSTGNLKIGMNKIAEFKFLVLENAASGNTKIYQMDGEDSLKCLNSEEVIVSCGESKLSELKYSIKKSSVNKLTSIKINGSELEYFNEDKTDYDITVESSVEKVNIEVVKKDSKSTISGNYGENKIKYGLNKLVITVTSESGEKNVYHINVTREDKRSSDNTLKTLTISSGELVFKPEIKEYNITVENEVDKITITSSLNDSKAKYVEDYQNKEIKLNEGSNKVEIKILSEKEEERVYTLNINRALSSNNSLKYIKVNDEKIPLKENEFIYNVEYENEVDEVIIKAEANDPKSTVKLNDKYPLEVGENEINIIVTAASGKEATYTLNITRKKMLSKDSYLTDIVIEGYNINFKQSQTTYDLKIKDNVDKLVITTTQEDPNATVEIEGNDDLIDGSIIKINVKAEDGTFTRYFIRIEKGSSGVSPIIIILIILFALLGLLVGIIFYRKKKKEKDEFDKLDQEAKVEKTVSDTKEEVKKEEPVEETKEEPDKENDAAPIEKESVKESLLEKGAHEYTGEHEQTENTVSNETIEQEIVEDEKKDME